MELSKLNIKGLSLLLQKVKIQFRSNLVFFSINLLTKTTMNLNQVYLPMMEHLARNDSNQEWLDTLTDFQQ